VPLDDVFVCDEPLRFCATFHVDEFMAADTCCWPLSDPAANADDAARLPAAITSKTLREFIDRIPTYCFGADKTRSFPASITFVISANKIGRPEEFALT
jgi:hypothetical protein